MIDSYQVQYVFERFDDAIRREIVEYVVETCETLRPSDGDVEAVLDSLSGPGSVRLRYAGTVFDFWLDEDGQEYMGLPIATVSIGERWILPAEDDSDEAAVARMNEFYTFLDDLYEQFVASGETPLYVYGLNYADYDKANDPEHVNHVSEDRLLAREITGIFWFPAFRIEQIEDGGVLLAGNEGVLVSEGEDYMEAAADHLDVPFEPI